MIMDAAVRFRGIGIVWVLGGVAPASKTASNCIAIQVTKQAEYILQFESQMVSLRLHWICFHKIIAAF